MEIRNGARGTTVDGIFFTEQAISGASPIRHLHIEISLQNSNLAQVKSRLAADAAALGANAIMNFKYGQKVHHWSQLISFKWDTESWHGEGDAVRI